MGRVFDLGVPVRPQRTSWIAGPEVVLKELRASKWGFAMMMAMKRKKKQHLQNEDFEKLKQQGLTEKIAEDINLAALFLRRKLKWLRMLLSSELDATSKDVFENKPEYFDQWFFELSREAW